MFLNHIYLIPLFPAFGAAMMFFFGRRLQKSTVSAVCVGAVVVAFLFACFAVVEYTHYAHGTGQPFEEVFVYTWLGSGDSASRLPQERRHGRRLQRRLRIPARSALRDLAALCYRRRHADPHLLHRIHGARRRLLPLLRIPEPLHVRHAHAHPGEQLHANVRWLGRRGPVLVSADRVLFPPQVGERRGE